MTEKLTFTDLMLSLPCISASVEAWRTCQNGGPTERREIRAGWYGALSLLSGQASKSVDGPGHTGALWWMGACGFPIHTEQIYRGSLTARVGLCSAA